ncbi:MAG: hypothetical protein H6Q15_1297 [Bacteroidetes bacterium]|nr:hypothetical protein [Bacteroidota bacterium]
MIKNVSFFVLAFFLSAVAFAQISTFGIVSDKPAYKLVNYDEDGFWSRLDTFYINYDDDLNILSTVAHNEEFEIKLDNKLYSLKYDYHTTYYEINGINLAKNIIDSAYLLCYDIASQTLSHKNLPNKDVYTECRMTYLKSKNAFAIASNRMDSASTQANPIKKLCLSIIDTSGNLLNYKEYENEAHDLCIAEQGNNILIEPLTQNIDRKLYYINSTSLDIFDSISVVEFGRIKVVNDSIIILSGCSDFVGIYNTISKTEKHYLINSGSASTARYLSYSIMQDEWDLNFRNLDSIFYCYMIFHYNPDAESGYPYENLGIKIANFNRDGDQNFSYIFNEFEPNDRKIPRGIVCTQDGGIIITLITDSVSYINGYFNTCFKNNYLLKLDFNGGIVGLRSLDPKKVIALAYPNPTKDFVNINCSSKIINLDIYNAIGQKVYSKKVGSESLRLDVSGFEKGNYILKIKTSEGETTKKIIVE